MVDQIYTGKLQQAVEALENFEPRIMDEQNATEEEEMEQDTPDILDSDSDESDSDSGSDEDESSEYDEVECEKRRQECNTEMTELESQFLELKEQLYRVRHTEVTGKLESVRKEDAPEYLNPLAELEKAMVVRQEVAEILRELKIKNIKNRHEAEMQAAKQHYESEKSLLCDAVKDDLEDKIRRLEEDRQNIDITSDLWNESHVKRRKKQSKRPPPGVATSPVSMFSPDRRRKPITVSGPFIVYMLQDNDIIDDWTTIKKALKQAEKDSSKKQNKYMGVKPSHQERHPFSAFYDDGRLHYQGELFGKGHNIVIDNQEDSPVRVTITAINTGEVWVKRADGTKSKLFISALQKGKYMIRRC